MPSSARTSSLGDGVHRPRRARRLRRPREHGPGLRDRVDPALVGSVRARADVPSSSKARRYQSPSQPSPRPRCGSSAAGRRQRRARPASPRARTAPANRVSVATRNQASQTLSPGPAAPDPVHAVVPVAAADERQAVRARVQAALQRPHAVLEHGVRRSVAEDAVVAVVLLRPRAGAPARNGTASSRMAASPVARRSAVTNGSQSEIVGACASGRRGPAAGATSAGRRPPRTGGARARRMCARAQLGRGVQQRQHVLQLVAEPERAAGLVEAVRPNSREASVW